MNIKKSYLFAVGGLLIAALLFGAWLFGSSPENKQTVDKAEAVSALQDAHGLAVDRKDSSKVYIATHTGLLVMKNNGDFTRVSDAKDDYMGFSAHPTNPNTFYTSGHPSSGGNIGFQKSTDGGKTWQKVSDGVGGPVDFHTMAVSQTDPNLIYGMYRGQLQRSDNEGKTWQIVSGGPAGVIVLTTSPTAKDTVYAGTANGLQVSRDQGKTWSGLSLSGTVTALAVNPTNEQEIVAYADGRGVMLSKDSGNTWSNLSSYKGGMVMHMTFDAQNPSVLYLINQSLEIHKTTNGGETWEKIR